MARKKKDNEEKKKGGGKMVSVLIVFLILFIWVITFAFLIKMDVGNLGTSLRPLMKDVPVLKYLLPSVSPEQEAWEENYPYDNMEEAVDRILELEAEVDKLMAENSAYQIRVSDLQAEVLRLRIFEDEQEAFAKRVKEFDRMVVLNEKAPELEEYRKFYEEINPETAEEIYRQVLEMLQYDEAIQTEAKRLTEMKPGNAAAILEEMTGSMELVASYLLCMKESESAAIVEKMDPLFAARVMQKIADMNEEKMSAIQEVLSQY